MGLSRSSAELSVDSRALFESVPIACAAVDVDAPRYSVIAASDVLLDLLHLDRAGIVGRSLLDVPLAIDRDTLRRTLWRTLRTHAAASSGFDDTRVLATPVFDAHQRMAQMIVRVETQPLPEPLSPERGAQAEAILESITDAFIAVDRDWRFTYLNHRAEDLLQQRKETLLGKVLWESFPNTVETPIGFQYRLAMETQQTQVFEEFSLVLNRWLLIHAYPRPDGLAVYFHDITDRKRAEEAVRESETRARSILEHSMDSVLLMREGRIVSANSAAQEMLGYSEDELRRLPRGAVLDETSAESRAAAEERQRTGHFRGELAVRRKDGTTIPVEAASTLFHDAGGAECVSISLRDVRARKAHEAERERLNAQVNAERERLRAILEAAPLAIVLLDLTEHVSFNARMEEMLGMPLQPNGGAHQYADRLRYPDGAPVPHDEILVNRVMRTGETILGREYLIVRPDGARFPVLASGGPVRDPAGRIVGGVALYQDLSERLRADESLRAQERLLRGIFDILPVGLRVADQEGRILRANAAAEKLLGGNLAPEAWNAETNEVIPTGSWPLDRALHGEPTLGELMRVRRADGSGNTILCSALPLRDDEGKPAGAIAVTEDVSRLKDAEDRLRRAVRLREEVLSVVAHDLRSPLGSITIATSMLKRTLKNLTVDDVAIIDGIRVQATRMNRLIQDLLDVAKMDSGHLSIEPSRQRAADILEDLRAAEEPLVRAAGLTLDVESLPGASVWADRDRLLQVFENLVGNAMKFTPPGGRITVRAHVVDDMVEFSVEDTGRGISAEHLPKIFDRFWQAETTGGRGAGLGLAIVRGIVEGHGGHVSVESEPGHGTRVHLTVPLARDDAARSASH